MSQMIERVAERMWKVAREFPFMPMFAHEQAWSADWPDDYAWMRDMVRAQAHAAIKAMREPSAAMLEGGGRAALVYPNAKWDDPHVQSDEAGLRTATVNTVAAVWEAMIDEVLK